MRRKYEVGGKNEKKRFNSIDSDNSSYGWGALELYRLRTCLFPGESQ